MGKDYPVLLAGKAVAEKYGVNGYPVFFIIDKGGRLFMLTLVMMKLSNQKLKKLLGTNYKLLCESLRLRRAMHRVADLNKL